MVWQIFSRFFAEVHADYLPLALGCLAQLFELLCLVGLQRFDINLDVAFNLCEWIEPEGPSVDTSSHVGYLHLLSTCLFLVDPFLEVVVDQFGPRWGEDKVNAFEIKMSTKHFVDERADCLASLADKVLGEVVIEEPVFSLRLKCPLVCYGLSSACDIGEALRVNF